MRQIFLGILFVSSTLWAAPGNIVDVSKSGVIGDGTTVNTIAIQKAIDDCSAHGGGKIEFSSGHYVTGTIQLKKNVTLHLDDNAILLGSTNAADYRNVDPFTDGRGSQLGYALVTAVDAKNVGIEGPGIIDGQGKALSIAEGSYTIRPFLVRWVRCENILVRDVRLQNSGAWTIHIFQSKNAAADHVTIRSQGLANNDGIDIDSCEMVRIKDCDIDTGDDAICLKTTCALPCRDITVTGCQLKSRCAAIKAGTESLGDFEKIQITHCQIRDTRLGGIKLLSVDGANLHDVTLSDITMTNVSVPIMLRLGARQKTFHVGDVKKPAGKFYDITIKNVQAVAARQIGILISGIPNHRIEKITLENVDIQLAGGGKVEDAQVKLPEKEAAYPEISMFGPVMPAYGIYARHVRGLDLYHVQTTVAKADERPPVVFEDVEK